MSEDGLRWHDYPEGRAGSPQYLFVAYGDGRFVAAGVDGVRTSTADGVTWTDEVRGDGCGRIERITFGDGRFVAATGGGLWVSADGLAWKRAATTGQTPNTGILWGGGRFVGSRGDTMVTSTDGLEWTVASPGRGGPELRYFAFDPPGP